MEDVVIHIEGLERFAAAIRQNSTHPLMADCYRAWASIYRGAMQERFASFSRGGGEWPPLKPSTILGRKHKIGRAHV